MYRNVESLCYTPGTNSVVRVKSLSHARLFATPWTAAHQASVSMRFSKQEYWSRLPFLSPGDLPWPRDRTWVSWTTGRFLTNQRRSLPYSKLSNDLPFQLESNPSFLMKLQCKLFNFIFFQSLPLLHCSSHTGSLSPKNMPDTFMP